MPVALSKRHEVSPHSSRKSSLGWHEVRTVKVSQTLSLNERQSRPKKESNTNATPKVKVKVKGGCRLDLMAHLSKSSLRLSICLSGHKWTEVIALGFQGVTPSP